MKPYRGLIVDFNHPPISHNATTVSPAIIHSVSEKGVNLTVFGLHGDRQYLDVAQGDGTGQWNFAAGPEKE